MRTLDQYPLMRNWKKKPAESLNPLLLSVSFNEELKVRPRGGAEPEELHRYPLMRNWKWEIGKVVGFKNRYPLMRNWKDFAKTRKGLFRWVSFNEELKENRPAFVYSQANGIL